MGIWHKYSWIAYLAVFLGVCGHASSEFFSVLSGLKGPELSVWRFLLGGFGLVVLALIFPASRDLVAPFREYKFRLVWLSLLGVTLGYLLFHWSLDYATVPQVATVVTTIPILVGLVNLWLNKQPFTAAKIISGMCATLGVALLITDGYLAKLAGAGQNLIGILMILACAAVMQGRTSRAPLARAVIMVVVARRTSMTTHKASSKWSGSKRGIRTASIFITGY